MLLAALAAAAALAAPPAETASPPPPAAPARAAAPNTTGVPTGVDANGVPAWAKRKHPQPVQACETKPGIGIETWRARYEPTGQGKTKTATPPATCR